MNVIHCVEKTAEAYTLQAHTIMYSDISGCVLMQNTYSSVTYSLLTSNSLSKW